MSATISHITPRLRLVDRARQAKREGTTLRYEPRQGVRELRCSTCHEIIRFGLCRCTPPAA